MSMIAQARHQLVHSALWSLMGTIVPMFAALLAVPWLMHYLGQERLGVLSLVWVVVGYFSFLDMGLGRAVTVAVAPLRPSSEQARREELHVLGSASTLLFGVGATAAVVLAIGIDVWGVPFQLSSDDLRHEVTNAILWTLPSLPLLLLSSSLRGYLEGVAAFRSLNLVRIPTGILLVAGPCLTAFYTPNLIWACICIAVVRLMHAIVLLVLVANQLRHGYSRFVCDLARASSTVWLRRLLTFGGWVTVSNVVGPVIIYVDRFVIGATLAASAVTAYAVPFDLVSRLPILVASVCSVLLPELARLSGLAVMTKPMAFTKANQLVKKSTLLSVGVVAGIALLGYFVTPWALEVWLGPDFRKQSTQVTRILLLAFGVNAVAQIPFTALQAVGKVRAVAMLHSAELVPYAALVFFAITWLGIEGAAWAWLFRSVVDYIILALMWHSHTAHSSSAIQI